MWTRDDLAGHLAALGIGTGDVVMVHAALRSIGPMLNGPVTLIDALQQTVGPSGALLAYTDWNAEYEAVLAQDGSVPDAYRDEIRPFDPRRSTANRENGAFPEFLRQTPGALRSRSPGASCVAIGAGADRLISGQSLDYGYGEHSPFARLCEAGGKVLMLGAPPDTMTLLHHAEHLARIMGKRIKRVEVPLLEEGKTVWRWIEEFDTAQPIVAGFDEDYFARIVMAAQEAGLTGTGRVGHANCLIVDAAEMCSFAVRWIEDHSSAL